FSSRRRHTRSDRDWSSDVCSSDLSPQAFEKVVDRLLASPRYGERWGRHWLDLARFAESEGFKADEPRPNAWRYRDYVIQSFNARSEERRVGKECRKRWGADQCKES